jgi:hypothetical protein
LFLLACLEKLGYEKAVVENDQISENFLKKIILTIIFGLMVSIHMLTKLVAEKNVFAYLYL